MCLLSGEPKLAEPSAKTGLGGAAKRLLTIPEAAAYLSTTVWATRCLIWDGRLPRVRLGRRYLLDVRDLDELVEAMKQKEIA